MFVTLLLLALDLETTGCVDCVSHVLVLVVVVLMVAELMVAVLMVVVLVVVAQGLAAACVNGVARW